MKIGIVGYGYVGKAMFKYFNSHCETIYYDPYVSGSSTQSDINLCDIGVICVNTPANTDGSCDISIVEDTVKWLTTPLILIKSTIKIGTTKYLKDKYNKRIVFSPEYIGESTYDTGLYNFNQLVKNHNFFIFGGDKKDTAYLVSVFQIISGPNKIYKQTDETSAEMAKYMENSFFATKLVFCYEFDQICKKMNIDYNEVRECWLLDPRIGSSHTCVFYNKNEPYDGKCLPKDLNSIIHSSIDLNYEPHFLMEVKNSNNRIKHIRVTQV
jgi:UDPglucose 6-dehydrogenase